MNILSITPKTISYRILVSWRRLELPEDPRPVRAPLEVVYGHARAQAPACIQNSAAARTTPFATTPNSLDVPHFITYFLPSHPFLKVDCLTFYPKHSIAITATGSYSGSCLRHKYFNLRSKGPTSTHVKFDTERQKMDNHLAVPAAAESWIILQRIQRSD